MLHLLTAWREDVGALDSRRLHVGQAERPQVLHALLHLQLIAWPSYTEEKKIKLCGRNTGKLLSHYLSFIAEKMPKSFIFKLTFVLSLDFF